MAFPSVPAYIAALNNPHSEPFAAHTCASLNGPPPEIDPAAQALECAERVREFLNSARLAREFGNRKQSSQFVRAALMCRFAAKNWRERARDAVAGMRWFNSLSEIERRRWLDIAWRQNQKTSGRAGYSIEDMPSAAEAWTAYKALAL